MNLIIQEIRERSVMLMNEADDIHMEMLGAKENNDMTEYANLLDAYMDVVHIVEGLEQAIEIIEYHESQKGISHYNKVMEEENNA